MRGEYVTIVNRTEQDLEVMKNGAIITLKPGENPNIPWEWVRFAKNQHPVMGTESAYAWGTMEFKVGVKDTKDNCEPIDPSVEEAVELIDRRELDPATVEQSHQRVSRSAVSSARPTHHTAGRNNA